MINKYIQYRNKCEDIQANALSAIDWAKRLMPLIEATHDPAELEVLMHLFKHLIKIVKINRDVWQGLTGEIDAIRNSRDVVSEIDEIVRRAEEGN